MFEWLARTPKIETVTPVGAGADFLNLPGWDHAIIVNSINLLGWEINIKTPAEWVGDRMKEKALDLFMEYLTVLPIVAGVSAGVYLLLGMFSKTLAKLGVIGCVVYSGIVFIFA